MSSANRLIFIFSSLKRIAVTVMCYFLRSIDISLLSHSPQRKNVPRKKIRDLRVNFPLSINFTTFSITLSSSYRFLVGRQRMSIPNVIVIGGTAGTGKSTIGVQVAAHYGVKYIEGDDVHPKENIEKMAKGIPLEDEDRWGWLEKIAEISSQEALNTPNRMSVVSCSALKKVYREKLESHSPSTNFIYLFLYATKDELIRRTAARKNHFMKPEMLDSQFAALQLPKSEEEPNCVVLNVTGRSVEDIVKEGIQIVEAHKK